MPADSQPEKEPAGTDLRHRRHRRRERVLAAGRRATFAGRALALCVGCLCAANGGSQSCPDSEQGCTWQWRDGKAGPTTGRLSCVRNISGVSCAAGNPGPECCTNGTQCLQTAKAACVADYRCRAVAFDTRDGWGARLYGADYTPETLFGWEMYIKVCPGCTDRLATNFARNATEDDGSCTYIEGCLDPDNANYNPAAGRDTTPSSCAAPPEPEPEPPEPEPPPAPEPEPEPEPYACPADEAAALSQRLLDLASAAECFDVLSLDSSAETYDCSRDCEDVVRAEGVFHVCETELARGSSVGAPPPADRPDLLCPRAPACL